MLEQSIPMSLLRVIMFLHHPATQIELPPKTIAARDESASVNTLEHHVILLHQNGEQRVVPVMRLCVVVLPKTIAHQTQALGEIRCVLWVRW